MSGQTTAHRGSARRAPREQSGGTVFYPVAHGVRSYKAGTISALERLRTWWRALCFACFPLSTLADQPAWRLAVIGSDHSPVASIELAETGAWCLIWNHSVQGFPVEDCFRVQAGQLLLDSSHQPDFAAGLGHTPGRGRLESDDQHGYRIVDMQVPVPNNQLWLRVGAESVNHRIKAGPRLVSLSQLAAGERVRIQLTPATENGHQDP